jgi:hypothetical protein
MAPFTLFTPASWVRSPSGTATCAHATVSIIMQKTKQAKPFMALIFIRIDIYKFHIPDY